jgi:hypothetical protein
MLCCSSALITRSHNGDGPLDGALDGANPKRLGAPIAAGMGRNTAEGHVDAACEQLSCWYSYDRAHTRAVCTAMAPAIIDRRRQ